MQYYNVVHRGHAPRRKPPHLEPFGAYLREPTQKAKRVKRRDVRPPFMRQIQYYFISFPGRVFLRIERRETDSVSIIVITPRVIYRKRTAHTHTHTHRTYIYIICEFTLRIGSNERARLFVFFSRIRRVKDGGKSDRLASYIR